MAPSYKLHYFDVRGFGEPIRLFLHYHGLKFEDVRYPLPNQPDQSKWQAMKPKTPQGKLPVLEVDGKMLGQSLAISRYLAKKHGLAGKDDWEQAKIDELADFSRDIFKELGDYIPVAFGFKPGDKAKLHAEIFVPAIEKSYPIIQKSLKESGSGFAVKSGLTWVDFVLAEVITTFNGLDPELAKKYPDLAKYVEKVHSVPQIKKYVESRPKAQV
ncbi:glutathione S-transferase 1 [Ditylenchus destructor]|uniref:glutathione transferase n=1 Tax=Ditylenchus destructor TaxID=166010 RepID=A0AAD4R5W5_9BILA|nr:glutathione S-transferase 1 [Ditylenchus destructor]